MSRRNSPSGVLGKNLKTFDQALKESRLFPLKAMGIEVFQINFGRLCNQSCRHCHVEAGPNRREMITRPILEHCLAILHQTEIPTVDITGGAPEMNPHFTWFVKECRNLQKHVMVRCNLTILLEAGYEHLVNFYAQNQIEIVASLPYYLERNVDAQRGRGVFEKSIRVLKMLNAIGYGLEGGSLLLHLVYNPGGAFLPPSQKAVESDFKRQLKRRHQIEFNHLFTMTNMPIGRFHRFLRQSNNLDSYMLRLINSYNPVAAENVMCRYTLSIGWDGRLYDCDFNQMLGLTCDHGAPVHIEDFDYEKIKTRRIVTRSHCFGCTAGAGSSCGGAVAN